MTAVLRESVCAGVWRDRQASRDRQADSNTHSKDTEGTQELPKQRGRRRVKERETGTETKGSRQYEYLSQLLSAAGIPCKGGSRG